MAKMAVCSSLTTTTTHFSCCNSRCLCPTISSSLSSSFLPLLNLPQQRLRLRLRPLPLYSLSLQPRTTRTRTRNRTITITRAFGTNNNKNNKKDSSSNSTKQQQDQDEEEEEEFEQVEEDLPWIQEKALDFVEFTGSVTQAIPGPRVAHTSLPWFLAVPLAFLGLTFVTSFVKTVNKFTSPKAQRRKLISKNAMLNKTIDELFEKGRDAVQYSAFEDIVKKTGFGMEDVLRKYLRYAFNDKPFNGDTVADLIQLRKASMLTDSQVAEILNDISRRIVKDKGPVVMDASGYTERGFKRKLAVQALFGKVFYLSELPEFCSRDSSLIVKEIFGVTDEDAEKLRIHSLSNPGDIEALEWMIEDGSDSEGKDES